MNDFEKEVITKLTQIETKLNALPCDKHGKQIDKLDKSINGENGSIGIWEEVRRIKWENKRMASIIPSGIILIYELIKFKITGKW